MKKPLITIIVPCFNAQNTIKETIESVLKQTYNNYEILIINDGSTDNSVEVCTNYTHSDDRISIISINNQGVSVARNIGIQHAQGEYIAFLDSDDLWHPKKLEKQIEYLSDHPDVGVCFSKVEFLSQAGQSLNQYSTVPAQGLVATGLLTENLTCTTSNILCRQQVIKDVGPFNTTMSFAEDQEWLLRVALMSTWRIMGLQEVYVGYRTNQGSLSSQLNRMEQGWESLVCQVRCYAPQFIDKHYLPAKAIYYRYLARRSLRQGDSPLIGLTYMQNLWRHDKWLYVKQPKRTIATVVCLYLMQLFYMGKSSLGKI